MDAEGNESPSQPDDGNFQLEEPDNNALTVHHVGVAYGCNDDNVYIPTSAEVYDSIDQDHLFAPTDNNNTSSDEAPVFLGMVLTANDDDDDDDDEAPESEPEDMDDDNPEPLPRGFDVNNPINVLATAIH